MLKSFKYFFYHLFTGKNFLIICIIFILQGMLYSAYLPENHWTTAIQEVVWNFYGTAYTGFELLKWLLHQIPLYAFLGVFLQKQWHNLIYVLPRIQTSTKWWTNIACTSFLFMGAYFFLGFSVTGIYFSIIKWIFPLYAVTSDKIPFYVQSPSSMIHLFLLMWLHAFLLFLIYVAIFCLFKNLAVSFISIVVMIYFSIFALQLSVPISAYLPTAQSMLLVHEQFNLSFTYSYIFFMILIMIIYTGLHMLFLRKNEIIWKMKEDD